MRQNIVKLKVFAIRAFNMFLICLVLFAVYCAPTKQELSGKDTEALKDLWLKSSTVSTREKIVSELEKRKDVDALIFCLDFAKYYYKRNASKNAWGKFPVQDSIIIVNALGRLKDPKAINTIAETGRLSKDFVNNELKLATLQAYKEIQHPNVILPTLKFFNDPETEIRWHVLDTLSVIKTPPSMQAIFPALFDNEPNIRWKAVHALGEIGNPLAAGRIGLLLADPDESVRGLAENVLRKLGTSEEKIAEWKQKADQLSIDEVYRTKLAYQKAEIEKQELAKKLESEKDLKKQLEASLINQETALGKQKNLIESLYEKERQLKSKQAQLDITRQQSEEYQSELQGLNAKVQSLNAELKQAKTQAVTENVREELDKTLEAKSKLEQDARKSHAKESMLREEIASLSALAEKTRLEAEDAKNEVAALRDREKQLATKVDELKQRLDRSMAPVLVVSKPKDGTKIESPNILLHFIAVDDKGISKIDVSLNGNPVKLGHHRGIKIVSAEGKISKTIDIAEKLNLEYGQNILAVSVTDTDGISQAESLKIIRVKERGDIWAIVIGINQYQNARNLKYAINDAQAFRDYLKDYVGISDERIFYLADQDATKTKIESLLGTTIKRKASKDDTVIIFYAGHGAVEPDPLNQDGDGFEKYLLPHDADLEDLYSTSISMNDIRTIFMRIRADRLIFIADTCYSGASGGRTLMATKTRANLSDKFYERISKGKGRVIISSCSANEISKEDDNLKHGIFSYYLLKGLKGQADQDRDGIITVSEVFSYLSRKVPQASDQDQHPVKKGETEGEPVIGRVK